MAETLAAALVAALSEMPSIKKDNTADTGSYTYDYANFASIIHSVRPVLTAHDLAYFQSVHGHDGGLAITTTILHVSGEREEFGPLAFSKGNNPQTTGSAISYFRRYALLAALGLAPEDDDGAAASQSAPAAEPLPEGESVTAAKKRITAAGFDTADAKALWEQADLPIETVTINGESVRWVSPEAVSVLEALIASDWIPDADATEDAF